MSFLENFMIFMSFLEVFMNLSASLLMAVHEARPGYPTRDTLFFSPNHL